LLERWNRVSLRTQLVAIISVLVATTIAVLSAFTIAFIRNDLIGRLDINLKNNAEIMGGVLLSRDDANLRLSGYYGALLLPDGTSIRKTPRVDGDAPAVPALTLPQVLQYGNSPIYDLKGTAPGSPGWRAFAYVLPNQGGTVVIARSYKEINDTVDSATALSLLLGLFATVSASAIAWLAVTRAFRPLARVEKTAAAIAAGDLSRRVEVDNPATEIGRLSSSLNAMLAHIETAFAAKAASETRMRRFVADASHEEDVKAAMGRIEAEAQRMGQLVEDLLTLARVDEQRPLESKPLDLLLLGNDAAMDARASAPDREISVIGLDGAAPRPAPVVGDEGRLRQVMANLVTNALRYTPGGSPIEIAVGVEPVIADSVIEVRDHGPGISDDDAARVFERFYRSDTSRYRETGGTGLGLAIVAALVAQHDGTVRLSETEGGGATMSIRIPYEPLPEVADRNYEID
jgi:two-component system OmpR family sensor kinase